MFYGFRGSVREADIANKSYKKKKERLLNVNHIIKPRVMDLATTSNEFVSKEEMKKRLKSYTKDFNKKEAKKTILNESINDQSRISYKSNCSDNL